MADPVGAAIAFSSLGATVLTLGLLFLLNPWSREVRWYALFLAGISAWLLAQGVLLVAGEWAGAWRAVYGGAVFALPGLFLAATLARVAERQPWAPWCALAATVAAVPLGIAVLWRPAPTALELTALVWQVAGWGGASYLHWRHGRRQVPKVPARRRAYRLVTTLLIIPAVVVAGAMVLGADRFFVYVMPLIMFVVHLVVFIGVIWLRFYDVEVRAARSGDLAGRALEAERLAAVGEVAASVAHEVRNPLTGVRSLAQRMAEEEVDPERWRRYAGVIVEEVGRVDRIVGNLLAVARRPAAGERSAAPTALGPLFEDLLLLTSARAERSGVALEADAAGIVAAAPREQLAQVLLNLVLNAIQHTPEGGRVRVLAEANRTVEILVRDSGPGVPPADRERIFEPFHTGSADGSGLGLSVVRRIAAEEGWTVRAGDAPGGGAEFRVVLGGPPVDGRVEGPVEGVITAGAGARRRGHPLRPTPS